jgi:hypothetical protein
MPGPDDQLLLDPDTFSHWRSMYATIIQNYLDGERGVRDAHASIFQSEQLVAKANLTPGARGKADALLVEARRLLAEAEMFADNAAQLRIRTLIKTVGLVGDNINTIRKWRAKVTLGEIGFGPGFDSDLAGLEQRYAQFYRPAFPILTAGIIDIPDARQWGEQEWAEWGRIEGPMFFWGIQECRDNWKVPNVPACEGPDLFTSFSLINQIHEAWKNEVDMINEFPVLGLLDKMLGGHFEEAAEIIEKIDEILTRITNVIKEVAKLIEKVVHTLAATPGILLVGGAIALYVFSRKNK